MSALDYFSSLTDPRVDRTKSHLLSDIVFITISAVLCGAETWNDIENYGKAKLDWLKTRLALPNGIPSHDTFNRVFGALDHQELEGCFLDWTKEVCRLSEGEVVSIDGKSLRGSRRSGSKAMIHMVSAWAGGNGMVLGQRKTGEKSNEITAIPKLLEVLNLEGCTVTIDAMGCQTGIAEKIRGKGADYVLAVKGNQPGLKEGISDTARLEKPFAEWEEKDMGHGRIEKRTCRLYTDFSHIEHPERWPGLKALVVIRASREHKLDGKKETETRYYISSMEPDPEKTAKAVRSHWGIENSLHWVLDVAFAEDKSRKRAGAGAENFSVINRIALNLLRAETSKKRSVKGKRLDAAWDNGYLLKILNN